MHKFYNGRVESDSPVIKLTDDNLDKEIGNYYDELGKNLEGYRFRQAMQNVMDIARLGNRYLTEQEPWKTIKSDPAAAKTALHNSLILIGHLATCLQPFLPATARKIFGMMNVDELTFDQEMVLANGHRLNPAALLFEKVEDEVIAIQIQKLADKKNTVSVKQQPVAAPAKANITFDDFVKMDIRTGTILTAEKVAKTKKLLKLTIDTGIDERTIVSGIAEHYEPEHIIGRQVSILVNLEPREIKGILSQGMILMAEDAEGRLCFVPPADAMPNGSVIR